MPRRSAGRSGPAWSSVLGGEERADVELGARRWSSTGRGQAGAREGRSAAELDGEGADRCSRGRELGVELDEEGAGRRSVGSSWWSSAGRGQADAPWGACDGARWGGAGASVFAFAVGVC